MSNIDTDEFHAYIDDLLTYMALAKPVRSKDSIDYIAPSHFDRAQPLTKRYLKLVGNSTPEQDREMDLKYGIKKEPNGGIDPKNLLKFFDSFAGTRPTEAKAAIDHAIIKDATGTGSGVYKFALLRLRQIPNNQARGHVAVQCRLNFLLSRALVTHDGEVRKGMHSYVGYNNGRWITEPHNRSVLENSLIEVDMQAHACMLTAQQITSEQFWKVRIGWDSLPRITFNTDVLGVREVFRLRDIPNGAQRRAALRHWVGEHWRENEKDRIKVRRHLRGAIKFSWNGLQCEIEPSLLDRKDNQEIVKLVSPEQLADALKDIEQ